MLNGDVIHLFLGLNDLDRNINSFRKHILSDQSYFLLKVQDLCVKIYAVYCFKIVFILYVIADEI